jgi:dUTP pyrophosphatase
MQRPVVKYNNESWRPQYHGKSAGFDISVNDEYVFNGGEFKIVHTGLTIEGLEDHFLMLSPRSSLFKKKGLLLVNSPGIIDEDYSGPEDEIMLALFNPTANTSIIKAGERVAQGLFVPVTRVDFKHVKSLEGVNRGGFGSTG